MNREIKFRGKLLDTGEWLYGDLIRNAIGAFAIVPPFGAETNGLGDYEVHEETVGQFTGLHDKNGKEIYEWDILHFAGIVSGYSYSVVQWNNEIGAWCVRLKYESHVGCKPLGKWMENYYIETVGNIHDNPELIN